MPRSHSKTQTRLTFDPLPSSTPAKSQYSPAIRERLSGVGYVGSQSKRRKVTFEGHADSDDDVADVNDAVTIFPTPAMSSSQRSPSSQVRSKGKKASQGKIDFSNHIGTSIERDVERRKEHNGSSSQARTPSSSRKLKKNPFRDTNSSAKTLSSESSSDSDAPRHSSPPASTRRTRSHVHNDSDQEQEEEEAASDLEPVRRSKRSNKPRTSIIISSDEEGADADFDGALDSDIRQANDSGLNDLGEPETSGDEVMHSSPTRKTKARAGRDSGKAHQIAAMIRGDDFVVSDGEPIEVSAGPGRRGTKHKDARKRRESKARPSASRKSRAQAKEDAYEEDGFLVDDDDEDEDEDEELEEEAAGTDPSPHADQAPLTDDDEDDDIVQTPAKRRRLIRKDTESSRRKSRREEEDLAEDLDFLGSAKDSPSRLRSSASTTKSSAKLEALEEFKRRRAGKNADPSSSAIQSSQRRKKALYDTESEEDASEQEEDPEDDDEIEEVAPTATAREMFEEDDQEDEYIVDDDDPLGVPDTDAQVPLAFSKLRFAKSKDLFKYVVEWMVQKKLNPAFDKYNEIYQLAFQKVDDEAKGLVGSKFVSSAWTPAFVRTLKARPRISVAETGADGMHHCEACNKKSHPATWSVQFGGRPYSIKTLEDLEQDDDDEDNDDDEDEDDDSSNNSEKGEMYDAMGNLLPPKSHVFHLGVTCQQNAYTAHTLEHWRYHLNEWVVEYLRSQGHLKPERIVERDGWKVKKRKKFANKVTDEMDSNGEISTLYKVFKAEIEAAHEAKGSGYERY